MNTGKTENTPDRTSKSGGGFAENSNMWPVHACVCVLLRGGLGEAIVEAHRGEFDVLMIPKGLLTVPTAVHFRPKMEPRHRHTAAHTLLLTPGLRWCSGAPWINGRWTSGPVGPSQSASLRAGNATHGHPRESRQTHTDTHTQ